VISGSSRVFALLGQPVAHSLSPAMHNAAFHALGLPAAYVALPCAAEDVEPLMRALARAGGGGNVTVPHKRAAAAAVGGGALVRRLEACNTFWGDAGALRGENTDVAGIVTALDRLAPPDGPWLVVGTGGSARAVAAAAAASGAALAVRSRDPARARAFADWAATIGAGRAEPAAARVVINATPLGLSPGDPLPVGDAEIPLAEVALDLVYARGETRWVRHARAQGLRAADGRAMLVAQGAAAFACWYPQVPPPVEVMRAAVDAALR
jgi:shikimate dehydrogenase